jgi:hypothetical protein
MREKMKILAIDCGTQTGWAAYSNGIIESGVQDFSLKRGESAGMRFLLFGKWLSSIWFRGVASQNPIERERLAWAAGFYDGEGSTATYHAYTKEHVAKDGKKSILSSDNISMAVSQVDKRPIERFKSIMGNVGSINGPYKDKRPTSSPIWWYRISGVNNVREALRKLWPWLSEPKREQAEKALGKRLVKMKRFGGLKSDGLIIYEAPHFRGGYATDLLVGMTTRIQEFAAMYGIKYTSIHSATLKKFATGKGNADKGQMLEEARRRFGSHISDHNEADALLMIDWAREEFSE